MPFLAFDVEIRKVICSTNAIESVNARIRRTARARGHFPNPQAALKCVYTALMSLDPTGNGRKRWTMRWKAPLNAFANGLELDRAAVDAGLTLPYHNGRAEGVNTRTKRIMRQMHGRAGFPLLRHRILLH
ncbi:hypothetical protein GCM10009760_62260 [Kitasatospora kazusensis]|uniref:Mutator family transposase n=1 Tax=Kitasatospora kazusensis TaxID=407974 RepID=A0ABP4KBD8_9ACTN